MEQNLLLRACNSGQETVQAVVHLIVGHQKVFGQICAREGGKRKTEISVLNGEVKNEWQRGHLDCKALQDFAPVLMFVASNQCELRCKHI